MKAYARLRSASGPRRTEGWGDGSSLLRHRTRARSVIILEGRRDGGRVFVFRHRTRARGVIILEAPREIGPSGSLEGRTSTERRVSLGNWP